MLHRRQVVAALGAITRLFSVAFLFPVLIAIVYDPYVPMMGVHMPRNVLIFVFCFCITYMVGAALGWIGGADPTELQEREAYLTVGIGWLLLAALSSVPFLLTGELTGVDAFFEAMSGITATGATVMAQELEVVDRSLMIWRALLQYLGGLGIVVLGVALLARLTHGGVQMLQAETPGPSITRTAPRLAQTARIMWAIYLGMGAVFFVLMSLLLLRHDLSGKDVVYEALLHTFTTIATGGFSNHHASIAYFDDAALEILIVFFILAAGTNFALLHMFLKGRWRTAIRDAEFRFYMANFVFVTLLVTGVLWRAGIAFVDALRGATFTIAAMMTSTGFVAVDYDAWPAEARMLVLFVMVAGGSAGSTSGGMKLVRILLLLKIVTREFRRIQHPGAVIPVRVAGRTVKAPTVMTVVAFFFAFVTIWVLGAMLLVATDPVLKDPVDAASASLAAISNIGPALGVVGPTQTYAPLAASSKLILAVQMWFGRLEIFTALLIFMPATWRH